MSITTIDFPSIYESSFGNNENSARELLNGMKVKRNDHWYLVGNLAKKSAINAGRVINAAPNEDDFDILFRSAILNVMDHVQAPYTITTGFPMATYNIYKNIAEQYLSKRHFMLEHDSNIFNLKGGIKKNTFEIDLYEVIPEIVGGIIGLKKTIAKAETENLIALSFGFGTVEGAMATKDGLIHRTTFSSHGIRYVIANLTRELNQKYALGMKNEHQMDDAFAKGSLFANRKRIDLQAMRKDLLMQYYREVVSPLFRKYFTDADLESCDKIYLIGGGAHYKELTDAVAEEFLNIIPVEVVADPENIVSIGYLYNSVRVSDSKPERCIGIDLGNATTGVSYFEK